MFHTIIENVMGSPLRKAVKLCGSMFKLGCEGAELRRHRLFECSFLVLIPECRHGWAGDTIGVWGDKPRNPKKEWAKYRSKTIGVFGGKARDRSIRNRQRRRTITVTGSTPQQNVVHNWICDTFSIEEAQEAMGIDWMPMRELSQAVPPAYAEFLGRAAASL